MTRRRWLVLAPFLLLFTLGGSCMLLSKPLPEGQATAEADALARKVEEAVNRTAWDQTGAIAWTFAGRNQHLWDKNRMFSQVIWGEGSSQVKVQFDIQDRSRGRATRGGTPVTGEDAKKLIDDGYAKWINDSFWLNPLVKLFDPGTVRKLVLEAGAPPKLLLQYTTGGLTPGDSYLYTLGPDLIPTGWEMWVSIIPVGGVAASFEGWTTLSTGAKISTKHVIGPKTLELTDIKAAATAEALAGSDPFAGL